MIRRSGMDFAAASTQVSLEKVPAGFICRKLFFCMHLRHFRCGRDMLRIPYKTLAF